MSNDRVCDHDVARHALDSLSNVSEALRLRDHASSEVGAAQRRRDALAVQRWSEIRVRAGRRCGELLGAMAASGERAPRGGMEGKPTLDELGIKKGQAYRYAKLASIPADLFEAAISAAIAAHGEATTHRILESAVTGSRQGGARAVAARSIANEPACAVDLVEILADPSTRAELVRAWLAFNTHLDLLRNAWREREATRRDTAGASL